MLISWYFQLHIEMLWQVKAVPWVWKKKCDSFSQYLQSCILIQWYFSKSLSSASPNPVIFSDTSCHTLSIPSNMTFSFSGPLFSVNPHTHCYMQKANVTKLTENISTLNNKWPGCPSWLQFKLLIDLISEPVHSKRCWSLPLSLLAKPVGSSIHQEIKQHMLFLLC